MGLHTVMLRVKLLSLEFSWLGSITSWGKAIVLSHKHMHMYTCTHIHAHMHNLTLFIMQCPITAWSHHINVRFSTNNRAHRGGGEVAVIRIAVKFCLMGKRYWCYQHAQVTSSELWEFELYAAKVTGDLLTSGPTTRHSWLQWKGSLLYLLGTNVI